MSRLTPPQSAPYDKGAVVTACDSNYLPGALALLNSLRVHSPKLPVVVISQDWNSRDEAVFQAYKKRFRNHDVKRFEPRYDFSVFPTPKGPRTKYSATFTRAVYLRLAIPYVFPEFDRTLYLDSDVIAMRDVTPLLNMDLGKNALGALTDRGNPSLGQRADRFPNTYPVVGELRDEPYLNAGVMVVDHKKWRDEKITERCASLYPELRDGIKYPIQDPLNLVVAGRFAGIDSRWNTTTLTEYLGVRGVQRDEVYREEDDPWILHYFGKPKPWSPDFPEGRNRQRFETYAIEPQLMQQPRDRGIEGLGLSL